MYRSILYIIVPWYSQLQCGLPGGLCTNGGIVQSGQPICSLRYEEN